MRAKFPPIYEETIMDRTVLASRLVEIAHDLEALENRKTAVEDKPKIVVDEPKEVDQIAKKS